MSEPGKAVFLSYASQDAEAARRICDALRAAGVEVWFDQSELVGGDAWDAKIRRQIKECALFVPVISANTNARAEGYFRREWKLAVERTHDLADDVPFLFPVVLGDVAEATARVPDKFRELQWTRLRPDETAAGLAARVARLLTDGGPSSREAKPAASRELGPPGSRGAKSKSARGKWWWLAFPVAAALAGLYYVAGPAGKAIRGSPEPVRSGAAETATAADAGSEVARLRARIVPDKWQKGDFEAYSAVLDRVIESEPGNADAWALRSIINSLQVLRIIDPGTQPLEAGKVAAERAQRLAPDALLGQLARGLHLVAMVSRGGDPRASRPFVDRAVAALPPDSLTRYAELVSFWLGYDFENTERSARAWLAAEPAASFPAWILVGKGLALRRPAEAERWAVGSVNDPDLTGIRTLLNLAEVEFYLRADPVASRAMVDRVPLQSRGIGRVVYWRWLQAMVEGRWDLALQELAQVPDPMLRDTSYNGPKALLAGLAHRHAGRADAAAVQFAEAERQLREALAADPENEAFRSVLGVALAQAGRAAEARRELALVEPLLRGRPPTVYRARLVVAVLQAYAALGDPAAMAPWLRLLFTEPSNVPLTPASFRIDPRFSAMAGAPEIQALLQEFAHLDALPPSAGAAGPASRAAGDKSIAVLPFDNLSPEKDNEFFADGVHEDLLTALTRVRDLKVISRATVLLYRDPAKRNLRQIGADLGVAHVVQGSVRRAGSKARISVQLVDARTDQQLWAENFDRDLADIFAVQSEVAREITTALKATLTPAEVASIGRAPTRDPVAYDLFVRARALHQELGERGRTADYERIIAAYEQVLARDPGFVAAHQQLAQVHSILYWFGTLDPTPARAARIRAAVESAERLAPDSAETHLARGVYRYRVELDWPEALAEFRRAEIGLPNDGQLQFWLAVTHRRLGRWDEARRCFERAAELGPGDAATQENRTAFLVGLRRYDEAVAACDRAAQWLPANRIVQYSRALAQLARSGDLEAYIQYVTSLPEAAGGRSRSFDEFQAAMWRSDWTAAAAAAAKPDFGEVGDFGTNIVLRHPGHLRALLAWARGDQAAARRESGAAVAHYQSGQWNPRQRWVVVLERAHAAALGGQAGVAALDAGAALVELDRQDVYVAGLYRRTYGEVLLLAGRPGEALAQLRLHLAGPAQTPAALFRRDPLWSRLRDDPQFEEILGSARRL